MAWEKCQVCSHETALPTASHFLVRRRSLRAALGLLPGASHPILRTDPTPFLSLGKQLLSNRAGRAPAALGPRFQWPPGHPRLWATSVTNFPVGREIHVRQKGGLYPKPRLNCPSVSELFLFPLLPFLHRILFQDSVPACSLARSSSASLNHAVSSLHPSLTSSFRALAVLRRWSPIFPPAWVTRAFQGAT